MVVIEVVKNLGYCGLVCSFCHLKDTCDGCKSEKNCCGRHLSGDGCYQYNQQNGIKYGYNKDYDGLESEEVVLKLLRTGQK